jgi:hypothetical protein
MKRKGNKQHQEMGGNKKEQETVGKGKGGKQSCYLVLNHLNAVAYRSYL